MARDRVTFNKHGLLPKGDYVYTFDELRSSVFVKGPKNPVIPDWGQRMEGTPCKSGRNSC